MSDSAVGAASDTVPGFGQRTSPEVDSDSESASLWLKQASACKASAQSSLEP